MTRIIHCCWFGGPKTRLAEKCLASWRKFAPGWEIKVWDEGNVRRDLCGPGGGDGREFFEAAIAAKKWAMASDWLRMKALYEEGGIYLDLDVELVAPIDRLPNGEWVSGEMTANGGVWMNPGGGIALEKGSSVARHMLDAYAGLEFDPRREMMPWINARLAEVDLRTLDPEVMSPIEIDGIARKTERTVAVHWYAMSWATPMRRVMRWLSWHGMRCVVDAMLDIRRAALDSGWKARIVAIAAVMLTVASVVQGFRNGLQCADFHWESAALFLRGENPYRWFLEGRLYEGDVVGATQAPSTIAFILLFGLLPQYPAHVLWNVCNLVLTAFFLFFMWRLFFYEREGRAFAHGFWGFAVLFLCGVPWRVGIECGQHTMFSLAFFVAALLAMERRRHWLIVGILLSAALFKYIVTVPLAFVFIIRRQWKALACAGAIHIALTIALGIWTNTDPLTLVRQSMEIGAMLNPSGGDADLAGFASWFGVANAWPWAWAGYIVFGLAIVGYSIARLLGRHREVPLLADLSVLAILADLVFYHRCYDLVSLAFPLAFCMVRPFGIRTLPAWVLVVNAFFLLRIDFAFGLNIYTPVSFILHVLALVSVAGCVFSARFEKEVADSLP